MNIFLILAFLFFCGSLTGWILELLFRRFFSSSNPERKWINPGFLTGPYLPLYGFGLCFLYLLAELEQYLPFESAVLNKLLLFFLMAAVMTVIEYIAGLIFIKKMNIKLWDYSGEFGNIQGIICPKFSLAWALLGAVYYFLIHPYILGALDWLARNLAFSFIIGFFFGIFIIDFIYSAHILTKISKFASDNNIIVRYEELKEHIRKNNAQRKEKARFIFAFKSELPLGEQLRHYSEKQKRELSDKLHATVNKFKNK